LATPQPRHCPSRLPELSPRVAFIPESACCSAHSARGSRGEEASCAGDQPVA